MKTLFRFVVVSLFLTAISQFAFAQQSPMSGPSTTGMPAESFSERKTRILTMLEDRKMRLDKEKTCVEAASSFDDLMKCRPERPMGMRSGGMSQGRSGQ